MKKTAAVLAVFISLCILMGCKAVVNSPYDEMVNRSWSTVTQSGTAARLSFSENNATLTIMLASKENYSVSGVYSVDRAKLYITSVELCNTYTFDYRAYADRLELTYGGDTLTFLPEQ